MFSDLVIYEIIKCVVTIKKKIANIIYPNYSVKIM